MDILYFIKTRKEKGIDPSASYYNYTIDSPHDEKIKFEKEKNFKLVSIPDFPENKVPHEYFSKEMPCCYLIDWVKDVLEKEKIDNNNNIKIYYTFEEEEEEDYTEEYEIKENDMKPLNEICEYRFMDLKINFDDNAML
ncbi:hypothetical protein M9Y10_013568 [Tritrichomonas musculus]|uniref:Uncharacterized protein n=1 Tax=Tritrichomonas musculus TaxID=1915356 RepID=A0ABR2KX37_9EUKA